MNARLLYIAFDLRQKDLKFDETCRLRLVAPDPLESIPRRSYHIKMTLETFPYHIEPSAIIRDDPR